MLLGLRISDFAVIDEVEVEFGAGLTVLTGETGAGKSILVDALSLLLGGRADPDVVRAGADEAVVEGTFRRGPELLARLEAAGLPDLGEELSVRRVVGRGGRGKAYLNGSLVSVGILARVMKGQVDIAGQHEHIGLFDPAQHRLVLDRLAGTFELLSRYHAHWEALGQLSAEVRALGGDDEQGRQRADFLRFQLEELCRVDPKAGEDEALEAERRKLSGVQKLKLAASQTEALLLGQDDAALELLHRAEAQLLEASRLDPSLEGRLGQLRALSSELQALGRDVARYGAGIEADPSRLSEVEERLDAVKRLCRKHARDLGGVVRLKEELEKELRRLEGRGEELLALERKRTALTRAAEALAAELTAQRQQAAARLAQAVRVGLGQLALPKACFEVRLERAGQLTADGADLIEFHFSANAGEPPRPLARVASGGEASRVLLALKRALLDEDRSGTYVLDEADSGVSGAVAEVVGRMIKEVSEHRQVLCITHLPQVAAYADAHLLIRKGQARGRARSEVVPLLAGRERTTELARMLSGVELTREAEAAALALVRSAAKASATSARRVKPTGLSARTARVKAEKRARR